MEKRFETLIISDEEVRSLVSVEDAMEPVETAFREKALGRAQMPPKVYLFYRKYDGDLRVMPSYLEELEVSAVKIVNVHVNNRRLGLPTVMAVVVLVEPATGFPLCIMGGSWLTAVRTGAAGGVAAKYLARPDSEVLAFIGAGTQARTQLEALRLVLRELREVRVYDVSKEAAEKFSSFASTIAEGARVVICDSPRAAVEEADLVVTATPSRKPIVSDEWVRKGTHFNCVGADAPGKQELDPRILLRAKIVVDDVEQAIHSGEINVPFSEGILRREHIYGELGEVVAGLKRGRESEDEITVFASTGLAVQDAVTAKLVYDRARSRGLGRALRLVV
ncbi:MAG: alanine dehydrogenase [Fervidicoccaceae archaeon]